MRGLLVEDRTALERLRSQTTPRQAQYLRPGHARWQRACLADKQVHEENSAESRRELAQVFGEKIAQTARTTRSSRALEERCVVSGRSAASIIGGPSSATMAASSAAWRMLNFFASADCGARRSARLTVAAASTPPSARRSNKK